MANWDKYLYDWIDVGDSKVCPTCRARGSSPPQLFYAWGVTPGDGSTECGGKCRCVFLPHAIFALDTSFEGGKTILLELTKRRAQFPISIAFEEKVFRQVDELVLEYETITRNWNLPEIFYELPSGDQKRDFLRKVVRYVKEKNVPDYIRDSILQKNSWMKGELKWR
jgi:hypothetical protein